MICVRGEGGGGNAIDRWLCKNTIQLLGVPRCMLLLKVVSTTMRVYSTLCMGVLTTLSFESTTTSKYFEIHTSTILVSF